MPFPHLFSPLESPKLYLKNRIVQAPHHTLFYDEHGGVTEQLKAYHATRARGGVGLIIVDHCMVDWPIGKNSVKCLTIHQDKYIAGHSQLVEAVQRFGAKIALQINHAGRQGNSINTDGLGTVSASDNPSPSTGEISRPLTIPEIEAVIEKFAQAARRARVAGYDAVEIHAAHGYLLEQFLSPFTNRRTDSYGGSLENRTRMLVQTLLRTRELVGEDYPIIMRLSGDEFVDGGLHLPDVQEIVRVMDRTGVDIFNIAAAIYESRAYMFPIMSMEPGINVHLAAGIKAVVSKPVIAVGKLYTPDVAEEVLRQGKADLVAMARPLIADPDLPRKARAGLVDEIIPCVTCNHCIHRIRQALPMACAVNPRAGREHIPLLDPGQKAAAPLRIAVVGGGPAGMQAALTLRRRGHQVLLQEQRERLGGFPAVMGDQIIARDWHRMVNYFARQLQSAGVEVRLQTTATPAALSAWKPAAVVVATGAETAPQPGFAGPRVITPQQLFQGEVEPSGRVVVVGGGRSGSAAAPLAAFAGCQTTLVEATGQLVPDIDLAHRGHLLELIDNLGVQVRTGVRAERFDGEQVLTSAGPLPADWVVLALGRRPVNGLVQELRAAGLPVYAIGDAARPRSVIEATYSGFMVAHAIESEVDSRCSG